MKAFKRILKALGILIILGIIGIVIFYFSYNETLPKGQEGQEADALANKMLTAIKHDAYKSTDYLEWTFKGIHHYKWNKNRGKVEVYWDDALVSLNLKDKSKSEVFMKDVQIIGETANEMIAKATAYFNNDSYWLVAPHKVFDPGVTRSLVTLENGDKALLVTHNSGGTTPGDSYLWILNDKGLPKSYKMWTSIIPIGGLEASWEGWKQTRSGTMLPSSHKILFLNLDMGEVMGM